MDAPPNLNYVPPKYSILWDSKNAIGCHYRMLSLGERWHGDKPLLQFENYSSFNSPMISLHSCLESFDKLDRNLVTEE